MIREKEVLHLVFEFMDGNLYDLMKRYKTDNRLLSQEQVRNMM